MKSSIYEFVGFQNSLEMNNINTILEKIATLEEKVDRIFQILNQEKTTNIPKKDSIADTLTVLDSSINELNRTMTQVNKNIQANTQHLMLSTSFGVLNTYENLSSGKKEKYWNL